MRLLQRGDESQGFADSGAFPILLQFGLVSFTPLHDVRQCALRKTAPQDPAIPNTNRDLVLAVVGVEMRGIVIPVVHPDHDPQEAADLRHSRTVRLTLLLMGPVTLRAMVVGVEVIDASGCDREQ